MEKQKTRYRLDKKTGHLLEIPSKKQVRENVKKIREQKGKISYLNLRSLFMRLRQRKTSKDPEGHRPHARQGETARFSLHGST